MMRGISGHIRAYSLFLLNLPVRRELNVVRLIQVGIQGCTTVACKDKGEIQAEAAILQSGYDCILA